MKIRYGALTDVGMLRKENQDSFGVLQEKEFYFVCDGMGGGAAGDFASRAAVEMMLFSMKKMSSASKDAVLGEVQDGIAEEFQYPVAAIRLANRGLWNLTKKYPKLSGMGTTFVGLMFDPAAGKAHFYHVGDSRVYRLRQGTLDLLTRDHSKVNELIEQGKMREEEVKTAEIQSMITRALGTSGRVKIDHRMEDVLPGDRFVLCSDGLNGELEDGDIKRIIDGSPGNPEEAAQKLIAAANEAGGRDNTTVIVIDAAPEENGQTVAPAPQPARVTTIMEETPAESAAEDRLVKEILARAKITVPKSASGRSFLGNPLVIGILLTLIFFGAGVLITRAPKQVPDTALVDLAGKVTDLKIEVRVPLKEELAQFRKSDDTVAKLQMIQDWLRDKSGRTTALPGVEIILFRDGKERFKSMSGEVPVEATALDSGVYMLEARLDGYLIMNERMETKNMTAVHVEPSESVKPVTLLMVPAVQ